MNGSFPGEAHVHSPTYTREAQISSRVLYQALHLHIPSLPKRRYHCRCNRHVRTDAVTPHVNFNFNHVPARLPDDYHAHTDSILPSLQRLYPTFSRHVRTDSYKVTPHVHFNRVPSSLPDYRRHPRYGESLISRGGGGWGKIPGAPKNECRVDRPLFDHT